MPAQKRKKPSSQSPLAANSGQPVSPERSPKPSTSSLQPASPSKTVRISESESDGSPKEDAEDELYFESEDDATDGVSHDFEDLVADAHLLDPTSDSPVTLPSLSSIRDKCFKAANALSSLETRANAIQCLQGILSPERSKSPHPLRAAVMQDKWDLNTAEIFRLDRESGGEGMTGGKSQIYAEHPTEIYDEMNWPPSEDIARGLTAFDDQNDSFTMIHQRHMGNLDASRTHQDFSAQSYARNQSGLDPMSKESDLVRTWVTATAMANRKVRLLRGRQICTLYGDVKNVFDAEPDTEWEKKLLPNLRNLYEDYDHLRQLEIEEIVLNIADFGISGIHGRYAVSLRLLKAKGMSWDQGSVELRTWAVSSMAWRGIKATLILTATTTLSHALSEHLRSNPPPGLNSCLDMATGLKGIYLVYRVSHWASACSDKPESWLIIDSPNAHSFMTACLMSPKHRERLLELLPSLPSSYSLEDVRAAAHAQKCTLQKLLERCWRKLASESAKRTPSERAAASGSARATRAARAAGRLDRAQLERMDKINACKKRARAQLMASNARVRANAIDSSQPLQVNDALNAQTYQSLLSHRRAYKKSLREAHIRCKAHSVDPSTHLEEDDQILAMIYHNIFGVRYDAYKAVKAGTATEEQKRLAAYMVKRTAERSAARVAVKAGTATEEQKKIVAVSRGTKTDKRAIARKAVREGEATEEQAKLHNKQKAYTQAHHNDKLKLIRAAKKANNAAPEQLEYFSKYSHAEKLKVARAAIKDGTATQDQIDKVNRENANKRVSEKKRYKEKQRKAKQSS